MVAEQPSAQVEGSFSGDAPANNFAVSQELVRTPSGSAAGEDSCSRSDVQWMLSGDAACSVVLWQGASVAEVKAQVQESTGVPASQQRLFLNGKEVTTNTAITPDLMNEGDGLLQGGLRLVRTITDPMATDLGYFHAPPEAFKDLPHGEFTYVRQLATGFERDIFEYRRTREGRQPQGVAVKKLRQDCLNNRGDTEANERKVHLRTSNLQVPPAEDVLTEVGVLKYLAAQADLPLYLLRLQDAFSRCGDIWIVTELAEGGDLLTTVEQRGALSPVQAKAYSWQILQAVSYLHRHEIGHRDLSLENVLLKGGGVRVMDFGMAVRSTTSAGTALRYFRAVGKDYYRAPECYVPATAEVDAIVPAGASPGDVVAAPVGGKHICDVRLPAGAAPGRPCRAEVWGYVVPPVDIWATGVCLFIMMVGTPAWERADLIDPYFAYARENGLAELLRQWRKPALPAAAQELVDSMIGPQPADRPSAADCLASPWFEAMRNAQVALHPEAD